MFNKYIKDAQPCKKAEAWPANEIKSEIFFRISLEKLSY